MVHGAFWQGEQDGTGHVLMEGILLLNRIFGLFWKQGTDRPELVLI
jgi:hypothetical protein